MSIHPTSVNDPLDTNGAGVISLGGGVNVKFLPNPKKWEEPGGLVFSHPRKGNTQERCFSSVFFKSLLANSEVEIENTDPLSLTAPITCSVCALSGTIRYGRWEEIT